MRSREVGFRETLFEKSCTVGYRNIFKKQVSDLSERAGIQFALCEIRERFQNEFNHLCADCRTIRHTASCSLRTGRKSGTDKRNEISADSIFGELGDAFIVFPIGEYTHFSASFHLK